jgi:hypothetical protein
MDDSCASVLEMLNEDSPQILLSEFNSIYWG